MHRILIATLALICWSSPTFTAEKSEEVRIDVRVKSVNGKNITAKLEGLKEGGDSIAGEARLKGIITTKPIPGTKNSRVEIRWDRLSNNAKSVEMDSSFRSEFTINRKVRSGDGFKALGDIDALMKSATSLNKKTKEEARNNITRNVAKRGASGGSGSSGGSGIGGRFGGSSVPFPAAAQQPALSNTAPRFTESSSSSNTPAPEPFTLDDLTYDSSGCNPQWRYNVEGRQAIQQTKVLLRGEAQNGGACQDSDVVVALHENSAACTDIYDNSVNPAVRTAIRFTLEFTPPDSNIAVAIENGLCFERAEATPVHTNLTAEGCTPTFDFLGKQVIVWKRQTSVQDSVVTEIAPCAASDERLTMTEAPEGCDINDNNGNGHAVQQTRFTYIDPTTQQTLEARGCTDSLDSQYHYTHNTVACPILDDFESGFSYEQRRTYYTVGGVEREVSPCANTGVSWQHQVTAEGCTPQQVNTGTAVQTIEQTRKYIITEEGADPIYISECELGDVSETLIRSEICQDHALRYTTDLETNQSLVRMSYYILNDSAEKVYVENEQNQLRICETTTRAVRHSLDYSLCEDVIDRPAKQDTRRGKTVLDFDPVTDADLIALHQSEGSTVVALTDCQDIGIQAHERVETRQGDEESLGAIQVHPSNRGSGTFDFWYTYNAATNSVNFNRPNTRYNLPWSGHTVCCEDATVLQWDGTTAGNIARMGNRDNQQANRVFYDEKYCLDQTLNPPYTVAETGRPIALASQTVSIGLVSNFQSTPPAGTSHPTYCPAGVTGVRACSYFTCTATCQNAVKRKTFVVWRQSDGTTYEEEDPAQEVIQCNG